MNEWAPKPVDPNWLAKLEPQLRGQWMLSQASEEFLNTAIGLYRNVVMREFLNAAIEFVVNPKGIGVEVGVFSWKRELTQKHQRTKECHAPQLLGRAFRWSDDDEPKLKLRIICECWISALSRTKFSEELHQAIVSGESIEAFCASKGYPQ